MLGAKASATPTVNARVTGRSPSRRSAARDGKGAGGIEAPSMPTASSPSNGAARPPQRPWVAVDPVPAHGGVGRAQPVGARALGRLGARRVDQPVVELLV